jgi:heme-degrading monooxygenase HmoA
MIRIVKMHFKPEKANDFLEIFETAHPKITAMPGCQGVELLRDINQPEIMFTYSHWADEEALHNYRHSDLFIETWKKTRALFGEKAEAWSVLSVDRNTVSSQQ